MNLKLHSSTECTVTGMRIKCSLTLSKYCKLQQGILVRFVGKKQNKKPKGLR